ncbi:hypothetical protein Tco_0424681, partial [Tanacetum coccineum]
SWVRDTKDIRIASNPFLRPYPHTILYHITDFDLAVNVSQSFNCTSQISTSEEIDYDSPEPPKSLLKWYHYLSDEYKDNGRFWGSKSGSSDASSKAKVEARGSKAKLQASTKTLIVKSHILMQHVPGSLIRSTPFWGGNRLASKPKVIENQDLSDIGSPGAEGPIFQDPPSPDYVPGPEEPEQAPPSPIYIQSRVHPEEDPEEDDKEDPEEDLADYSADRGDDDDDDAEEEHLILTTLQLLAYSADRGPIPCFSRHGSGCPSAPAQRDALPSPVHETEMPEICLPLRKRPCRTTPGPGYEVGESSAAGTLLGRVNGCLRSSSILRGHITSATVMWLNSPRSQSSGSNHRDRRDADLLKAVP